MTQPTPAELRLAAAIAEARAKAQEALKRGLEAALAARGNGPQGNAGGLEAAGEGPRTPGGSGDAHGAAAIEAGARASFEADGVLDPHPYTWDDTPAIMLRDDYLRDAAVHYDAMEPHIRRQVAEEAARRIEELEAMLTASEQHTQHWERAAAVMERSIDKLAAARAELERQRDRVPLGYRWTDSSGVVRIIAPQEIDIIYGGRE